jgi:AraC-like DNA-binding protein
MFIFHIIHSGIKIVKGNYPELNLLLNPGEIIFGRVDKYDVVETIETEENVSTTVCLIPESRLVILMGTENTHLLYENLGLTSQGSIGFTKVPESISKKLENASSDNLEGAMRSLYAQSILLQFLLELHLYTSTSGKFLKELEKNSFNVEDLHLELLQIESKLPNLTELAKKYGTTAEKLNYTFTKSFGQTIYAFLSNQRLEQAYQALEKTDISMKVLAHKIGYSHVNHFITAFKRKFGVTPGTIRKT